MNDKEELAINSLEYQEMYEVIMKNKPRTSRDILCAKCWKMQSFWQHKRHLQFYENHAPFTINAKIYMIEEKFLETARNAGAVRIDEQGVEYIRNPLRVIGERQNTIRYLQKKFNVKKDVYDDLKLESKDF